VFCVKFECNMFICDVVFSSLQRAKENSSSSNEVS
jgi:hypothetical protein